MDFNFWPFRSSRKQREQEAQAAEEKRRREDIEARRRAFRASLLQSGSSPADGMAYRNAGIYPPYSPVVHSDPPSRDNGCHRSSGWSTSGDSSSVSDCGSSGSSDSGSSD